MYVNDKTNINKKKTGRNIMKKKYKIEHMDCANCAAKIETMIGKIDGVEGATLSFITQKLTIEAAEEHQARIIQEVSTIIKKQEPDWVVHI